MKLYSRNTLISTLIVIAASSIPIAADIAELASIIPISSIISGIDSCAKSAVKVIGTPRDGLKSNDESYDDEDGVAKIKREYIEADFAFDDFDHEFSSSDTTSTSLARDYGLNASPETQQLR